MADKWFYVSSGNFGINTKQGFKANTPFKNWHTGGTVGISEAGILEIRKHINNKTNGVVLLWEAHIHYNEQMTRQVNKSTWAAGGNITSNASAKVLINFGQFNKVFKVDNKTPTSDAISATEADVCSSKVVSLDTGIDLYDGRRLYFRMANGIYADTNGNIAGVSCPSAMNCTADNDSVDDMMGNYPLKMVGLNPHLEPYYKLVNQHDGPNDGYYEMLIVVDHIDLRTKRMTYHTIGAPLGETRIRQWERRSSGSRPRSIISTEGVWHYPDVIIPPVTIEAGEDSWNVTRIPYTIDDEIANGKGNLLLAASDAPSVVGYTKSEFSFHDKNGVSKLLTPVEMELNVNISRSADDTYTNVVVDGSYARVNDMEFTLLILGEDEQGTYINKIVSPLPGESKNLKIKLPITYNVPEINFNSALHNSLVAAIQTPNVATNYSVGVNVRTGYIHIEGSVIARESDNKKTLVVHMLPISVHYYPGDNSQTTTMLNQAFTMKIDIKAINDTVQVTSGLSTIDYSYSTSSGIIKTYDGISTVLPTNFFPYLRSVQLDAEAMTVNGDTIGFTVNVDKMVNKQILGTSTSYTEYYLGNKK